MSKEPKELYNGFLFLRTGDKVDSPLVAYTLNLESVNVDCLEEEFGEKIEALKNGKDVTIKLVCNKAEVVSPQRIIEYAVGKNDAFRKCITFCDTCRHWKNRHVCEKLSKYGTIETPAWFFCGYGDRKE